MLTDDPYWINGGGPRLGLNGTLRRPNRIGVGGLRAHRNWIRDRESDICSSARYLDGTSHPPSSAIFDLLEQIIKFFLKSIVLVEVAGLGDRTPCLFWTIEEDHEFAQVQPGRNDL